jgi:16S rRNA (guanine527-N7)-methyltransferase
MLREQLRAELVKGDFDFIVSRAVTNMQILCLGLKTKSKKKQARIENGFSI